MFIETVTLSARNHISPIRAFAKDLAGLFQSDSSVAARLHQNEVRVIHF
jgi:hypothetical protein